MSNIRILHKHVRSYARMHIRSCLSAHVAWLRCACPALCVLVVCLYLHLLHPLLQRHATSLYPTPSCLYLHQRVTQFLLCTCIGTDTEREESGTRVERGPGHDDNTDLDLHTAHSDDNTDTTHDACITFHVRECTRTSAHLSILCASLFCVRVCVC